MFKVSVYLLRLYKKKKGLVSLRDTRFFYLILFEENTSLKVYLLKPHTEPFSCHIYHKINAKNQKYANNVLITSHKSLS